MTTETVWQIPPSVLRWVQEVPADRPVAMLLRHSVRPPLAPGDAGYALPLTEAGIRLARELGATLGPRLRSLRTSPLLRCVQTAEGLRDGAGGTIEITPSRLLGDPGVFVLDGHAAWANWLERGHEGVMAHLVREPHALPGMAAPDPAARFLVHHMLETAGSQAGFHAFVTHDSLVTATAARLLGEPLGTDAWPWYLEAAFFWREGDVLHAAYRDLRRPTRRGPLCALDEDDVVEFARREVVATVGPRCGARFFLAGGAFKTLLTGRAPRDLDFWAPTAEDREALVGEIVRRGGRALQARPFGEAFEVDERVVDVPFKTEPDTLENRLSQFDIALSAVGVEHLPGGGWRAAVHPQALDSVTRREVLLLKPLVNWRYALSTLARMHRYADELGYDVPPGEVAEVWKVFEAQPRETRLAMIERLDGSAPGRDGILEEAKRRLR